MKGTAQDPVIFVSIPFDEIAIGTDGYGRTDFVSWRQKMERHGIRHAFPRGRFPDGFFTNSNMTQEVDLYQDFVKDPGGFGWHFRVSLKTEAGFIATDRYRTQPIAVPRYYRVPGEVYGRGPVLLALPSIKTLNKAQELALKSAAIQMLGIWLSAITAAISALDTRVAVLTQRLETLPNGQRTELHDRLKTVE